MTQLFPNAPLGTQRSKKGVFKVKRPARLEKLDQEELRNKLPE